MRPDVQGQASPGQHDAAAYGTRPSVRSLLRGEGLAEEANTVLGNGEARTAPFTKAPS